MRGHWTPTGAKPIKQCFPACVPRHKSVPRERWKCAEAECRKSIVFNEKFQWRFQLSLKTFDFLNSATAHFNCSIITSLHRCYVIIFYGLFRLSLHGRSLRSLYRHDFLFSQSRTTIIAQHRVYASVEVKPDYYTTLFLSDFKDKSQYYFPNLNVSGKKLIREQFCHQLDFFDLQTVKELQLIDIAACRLRFKLAETNLMDTFLHTEHCIHYNCKRMC